MNWTWVADDDRCRMPLGPADWCQALAGRAILFIGDSLSAQQVLSLLHLVGSSDLKWRKSGPVVDLTDDWRKTGAVKACGGKVRINYIRNDELSDRSFEGGCHSVTRGPLASTKLCRPFTSSKLLADYDTLVLNTGAHMPTTSTFRMNEMVVNRTRQLATWLRNTKHKLIWRTGVPGHVDCDKYSGPLETGSHIAYPQRDSPQYRYRWDRIEPNDKIRARIFEEVLPGRVRFLDAAALTRGRPDQHLLKGRFGGGKKDCLHYCLPGPIDTWNMVLARMLAH